jgi:hypothetical protein
MLIRLAVAMNPNELTQLKSALKRAKVRYLVPSECDETDCNHRACFPVMVSEEDEETAADALKAHRLDRLLVVF